MRHHLRKDTRVALTTDVDLHPYATLKAGERATVLWADYDDGELSQLELRMDAHHYGLSLFENCAILAGDAVLAVQAIATTLDALTEPSSLRVAASVLAALCTLV